MTGIGSSCGACKFLRRRCSEECVFAPHFCYDEAAATFAAVHKVFGASNVSKLLSNLPLQNRGEAAGTISYEALARMHDPVYGCVAHIFALQQQVVSLQEEIETLEIQMATHSVDDNLNNNGYFPYAPPNINNGLEFSSHEQDEVYMQILQTCQTHENPIISQTRNISANRALFSQMNLQTPQVSGPGEQSSLPYLSPNPFEILFEEGVDQEIFPMQHQLMYFQN